MQSGPTSYAQTTGFVADSQPRTISNLIVDQTAANPAAVAAAGTTPARRRRRQDPDHPERGAGRRPLRARSTRWFTLFGQFFDHGLDLVTKGGSGTVFVPLKPDDPLYDARRRAARRPTSWCSRAPPTSPAPTASSAPPTTSRSTPTRPRPSSTRTRPTPRTRRTRCSCASTRSMRRQAGGHRQAARRRRRRPRHLGRGQGAGARPARHRPRPTQDVHQRPAARDRPVRRVHPRPERLRPGRDRRPRTGRLLVEGNPAAPDQRRERRPHRPRLPRRHRPQRRAAPATAPARDADRRR